MKMRARFFFFVVTSVFAATYVGSVKADTCQSTTTHTDYALLQVPRSTTPDPLTGQYTRVLMHNSSDLGAVTTTAANLTNYGTGYCGGCQVGGVGTPVADNMFNTTSGQNNYALVSNLIFVDYNTVSGHKHNLAKIPASIFMIAQGSGSATLRPNGSHWDGVTVLNSSPCQDDQGNYYYKLQLTSRNCSADRGCHD